MSRKTIDPPDIHFLNAADGWLDLKNPAEARAELERIAPARQNHPAVLEMHWRICAAERSWHAALQVAREHVKVAPNEADSWINQSYSLHEMKRTDEAWKLLLPIAARFAKVSTIPYNLACYAAQLGNLEEARAWLDKAIKVGGRDEITRMALTDRDLEPLWAQLKSK